MSVSNLPERNNEGFLENATDWTADAAAVIAAEDDISLNDNHWEIIEFLRDFYKKA